MRLPSHPHHPLNLLLLTLLTTSTSAQGTITLALATSNSETAASATIPFNTLFAPSSSSSSSSQKLPKAVSLHANTGTDIPIPQSSIQCQCFSDTNGKEALGERFGTVFPGAVIGKEPVTIGSIFCADREGVDRLMRGVQAAAKVEVPEFTPTSAMGASSMTASSSAMVGMATTATTGMADAKDIQKDTQQSDDSATTVQLRFALSTDPSDDSSTQMTVSLDTITPLTAGSNNKKK
ncbi:MAG: hypothetical protein Q9168_008398, partial [Polycauliona sp. 1 TL-2023]